jgi:hypothetical protein
VRKSCFVDKRARTGKNLPAIRSGCGAIRSNTHVAQHRPPNRDHWRVRSACDSGIDGLSIVETPGEDCGYAQFFAGVDALILVQLRDDVTG